MGLGLEPEEGLYLLERGGLDVRFCEDDDGDGGGDGRDGMEMSLQAAYTFLIGQGGLTLERYVVYAGLKRSGYIVLRAPGWYASSDNDRIQAMGRGKGDVVSAKRGSPLIEVAKGLGLGVFGRLYEWLFGRKEMREGRRAGPLVQKGLYRSYSGYAAIWWEEQGQEMADWCCDR